MSEASVFRPPYHLNITKRILRRAAF